MSVIARQGFKYSIIGYLSFLLGTFSAIFIFPRDMEFYGKLRYILPTAEMLVPIAVFGVSYANVKFFYESSKAGKHQNVLTLSLVGVVVNFAVLLGLYFALSYAFPQLKTNKLWDMKLLIFPLVLILALSQVFNKYLSNYKRIAVSNIFENFFPKIANLGAFTLFFFIGFPEKAAYAFFFLIFLVALAGYAFYTNKLEPLKPDISLGYVRQNKFWKNFITYSFYGFLGNIGNYLTVRIDNYMIGEYIGFEQNGVYSTLYSILTLTTVPAMGLYNISAPVINKHLAENTLEELDAFHKKTSLSISFLGMLLFSCILVGFPYLTAFIKNGELLRQAEPVVWILGSAVLFDMVTGFNGHIISLSKYYRFNIVIMLFLAVMNIMLNLYFIRNTNLGIIGIAMATATSLTVYNLIKIVFNWWKFKVSPLSIEMIYAVIVCSLAVSVAILLPDADASGVNLIYKPTVVLLLILLGNHYLDIFPVRQYINRGFLKSLTKFKS
ncbi:MAG: polysaccharide biosynthesis protein [Chryseobacterium sp.]|nr:MAG: polysaccharide biosynthesis protein [Chryseobacterium sp.]